MSVTCEYRVDVRAKYLGRYLAAGLNGAFQPQRLSQRLNASCVRDFL